MFISAEIRRRDPPREVSHFVVLREINCEQFETQRQARLLILAFGGEDVFGLDRDRDGVPCESLPE